jgi:peptide methionine sulfoxide reductase msrA/msrB
MPDKNKIRTEKAIFAAGCFWGVENCFKQTKGVTSTSVGYTGGHTRNPTYEKVCNGDTGHAEAVEILFNPDSVTYEDLVKTFFEIHNPTTANSQGPDGGEQYRSEIFYLDKHQRDTAEKLIKMLNDKGNKVATRVTEATKFWKAEDYHQDYYGKKGTNTSCHFQTKRF